MKKFIKNIVMFILFIAIFGVVSYIFFNTLDNTALTVGIPLLIVYSLVCFFVKKIRSPITIWWGILSLLSAGWWIFLLK